MIQGISGILYNKYLLQFVMNFKAIVFHSVVLSFRRHIMSMLGKTRKCLEFPSIYILYLQDQHKFNIIQAKSCDRWVWRVWGMTRWQNYNNLKWWIMRSHQKTIDPQYNIITACGRGNHGDNDTIHNPLETMEELLWRITLLHTQQRLITHRMSPNLKPPSIN